MTASNRHGVGGVLFAMKRGATLHCGYHRGRECWHLSSGIEIRPDFAHEVIGNRRVKSGNDGLFAGGAQTFFLDANA